MTCYAVADSITLSSFVTNSLEPHASDGERVTASADDPQGIFAGIQQAVADTPWFVWAGAGATAAGVAYVVLTNGD